MQTIMLPTQRYKIVIKLTLFYPMELLLQSLLIKYGSMTFGEMEQEIMVAIVLFIKGIKMSPLCSKVVPLLQEILNKLLLAILKQQK